MISPNTNVRSAILVCLPFLAGSDKQISKETAIDIATNRFKRAGWQNWIIEDATLKDDGWFIVALRQEH